jgi:release factor glutamine methyltransferase
MLVATLVEECAPPPARILDLGTGSGAIALALAAAFPAAAVTAVDASDEALTLAKENAASAGLGGRVEFLRTNWFDGLPAEARFELIVANPPYLSESETAQAAPEVREHEPKAALVASDGGIADLRVIVAAAPRHLTPNGRLALETGIAQHAELGGLAQAAGLAMVESRRDLTGRDRFLFARLQPAP